MSMRQKKCKGASSMTTTLLWRKFLINKGRNHHARHDRHSKKAKRLLAEAEERSRNVALQGAVAWKKFMAPMVDPPIALMTLTTKQWTRTIDRVRGRPRLKPRQKIQMW